MNPHFCHKHFFRFQHVQTGISWDTSRPCSPKENIKESCQQQSNEEGQEGNELQNKEGYNPGNPGIASNVTDGKSTTGQDIYCSITTNDIQCKMPELRNEMHLLQDQLMEISSMDALLTIPLQSGDAMDDLLINSSTSAALVAILKDMKDCIKRHKAHISELEHGDPLPSSRSINSFSTKGKCPTLGGEGEMVQSE